MIKITGKFITSAGGAEGFLRTEKPVIAVCGKSNVGKSSFINMLANQKKLAKVSKDPGRTRLINYFDMGEFVLADLPGYGFARVSKQEKLKWAHFLEEFFKNKENVAHAFALTDIRHNPTEEDLEMVEFLYYNIIPYTVIATKGDKLSRAAQGRSVSNLSARYNCGTADIIVTSAQTRQGLDRVLARIEQILQTGENDDS